MPRNDRGDEVEREAHRSRVPATDDDLPLFGGELRGDEPLPPAPPILADTQEYLAGAEERIAVLPKPMPAPPWHRAEKGLAAVLKKNPPLGTIRERDSETSLSAALALMPRLSLMQAAVVAAFDKHGPMTDEQLEQLPEFREYKYSTARKRRTELVTKGLLASCGKAMNESGSAKMTLWDLTERVGKR